MYSRLGAVSPLDGRYGESVKSLSPYFSEAALMRYRLYVEVEYLIALSREKKIKDLIPYLCASDMYVGNDSFGSHITSQFGKKSIVLLLDSPRAYTDYSNNFYRIIPNGFNIEKLTHGSNADPNLISVNKVIEAINNFKN